MSQNQSPQQPCLIVEQLDYSIKQNKLIDNLSFSINGSKKIALVGLNGAGKSSLIRLLVGEVEAQQGLCQFNNSSPQSIDFKKSLGYQASEMQALDKLTSREYLKLCCLLKDITNTKIDQIIERLNQFWLLQDILDQKMSYLSQGNLQKLMISQAFIDEPEFIVLDEPSQALDPMAQQLFINNLKSLNETSLCLFSSHHISEAVEAANMVLMLHLGKKVAMLDLDSKTESWFISQIKIEQINNLPIAKKVLTELSYHQHKSLYRVDSSDGDIIRAYFSELKILDENLIELGSSEQALMPLFALLANEKL